MSNFAIQRPVTSNRIAQAGDVYPGNLNMGELNELALKGLGLMFDSKSQLFCYRLLRDPSRLVQEGLSRQYTIITLLGLHRAELAGLQFPFEVRSVLNSRLRDTAWVSNIGDLGLLLWLCALASPERLAEICLRLDVQHALARFREVRQGRTMELAWYLTGLAHARLAHQPEVPDLTDAAMKTYELLKDNQGHQGFFGHLARKRSLAGALRGHIGSFADQVYPIYGLTKFAEAFKMQRALEMARTCAEAICRAQGPLGEWWWHYDSSAGTVFERYPVYSVHQDGMAPMALFAVGEATRIDFSEPVYKGLQWITGKNELGRDLREMSAGVIWRSIYPRRRPPTVGTGKKYKTYFSKALSLLGSRSNDGAVDDLRITFECRPYHLGWLLYAFAGRGPSTGRSSTITPASS